MGQCIGCKRSSKGLDPLPDAPIARESSEREENKGRASEGSLMVVEEDVTIHSLTSQDTLQGVARGNEKDSSSITSQDSDGSSDEQGVARGNEEDSSSINSQEYDRSSDEQDDTRYKVWFRHSGEGDIDRIPPMPDTRVMTQSDIESEVRAHTITHMYIEDTIPDWLADIAPDLVSLKLEDISDIETQIHRLAELVNLEKLDIGYNRLTSHTLHPAIYEQKQLKVLDISYCALTELDDRLAELVNLENLNIRGNRFTSHNIHPAVYKLKQLKALDIVDCGLTELDDRLAELVNLESLNIAGNKFTSYTLHPAVYRLRQLKVLDISYCALRELDNRLVQLENLEKLYVSYNSSLTAIPHRIYNLRGLVKLDCDGCDSLTSPPYAVCKQGVNAVREYIKALKQEEGKNKRVFPVIVIGRSMAGKTSLVLSLQENKRVLTQRIDESKLDEATKVFKVREVKHGDNITILFYDCGGQAIYHYAYQLTFRTECVVLLVVDITEFDRIAIGEGVEAACQQTCMDWLSHLYIACPKVGKPVVALTHTEQMAPEVLAERKAQLIDMTENLRRSIIHHEILIADESSPFFTMRSFCDTSQPLIQPDMIFDFSSTSGEQELTKLREELSQAGSNLLTDVPGSWYSMIEYMAGNKEPLLSLAHIDERFPQDLQHFILQYVHELGKAFWFKKHPKLSKIVFHRVEVLTKMIEVLFNHNDDDMWRDRENKFSPYRHKDKVIGLRKYKEMIRNFRSTGIIDDSLLTNLMERESQIPPVVAIDVLKLLHIICGPIDSGKGYIIPYFSTEIISLVKAKDRVLLKSTVYLNGLPVPLYAYSLVSAFYIDLILTMFNRLSITCGQNGVRVEGDGTTKYLLHKPEDSSITLITSTPVSKLSDSWRSHLSTLQKLAGYLKSKWKAVRIEVVFYCSHCIMTDVQDPTAEIDPDWFADDLPQTAQYTSYSGHETFICSARDQRLSVPQPLLYPCSSINAEGETTLCEYISTLTTTAAAELVVTPQQVAGPVCTQIEERDIDQITQIVISSQALIDLEPEPLDRAHTACDRAIYEMTDTKGRALIISNHYNGTRAGSEHDHSNMERMLNKLGFVTSGGHRNYTAKDMVDEIHKETQLPIHNQLGAFVLVITSHGAEGSVIGSDHTHIRLADIYNLLSPRHFLSMKGKPKLIIIQACSGSRREMLLDEVPQLQQAQQAPHAGGDNRRILTAQTDDTELDSSPEDMSTADLLIMQSSMDTFASPRNKNTGSPFIRAIVGAFYKFAHKFHVETIAEIVRAAVNKYGVERTDELLRSMRIARREKAYVASMPKTVCTFTEMRRLYLRPETNRHNHPQSVTHPEPPARYTAILESETVTETHQVKRQGQVTESRENKRYTWIVRMI